MEQTRFITVPQISIHPDELYIYGRKEWITEPGFKRGNSMKNLLDNSNHNKMSEKSKQKAKRAIKYLIYNSSEKTTYNYKTKSKFKFKVGFITLTLSSKQNHSDQEIKKTLLNQFLIEAKKKWNMTNYVWKAEKQQNGNIHFHILTDVFIPWSELRNCWNRIQNKLSYVDKFEQVHHKKNPNSTDVHSLKNIENVAAYMVKYMTKNEIKHHEKVSSKVRPGLSGLGKNKLSVSIGAKKFLGRLSNNGRIWTCSKGLSDIRGGQHELTEEIEEELNLLEKQKGSRRINKDHFSGIFYKADILSKDKFPVLYSLLNDYIKTKFPRQQQTIWNDE
jgi:hypothetical protein